MTIPFTAWPEELAQQYLKAGYWTDDPLSSMLEKQVKARPDAIAIICGTRQVSYAKLDTLSSQLARALTLSGLKKYDTALVQLPNCADFYIVFFALIKMGIAPVNALFSHQRLELLAYAEQLAPKLFIGATSHALNRDLEFITQLRHQSPSLQRVLLLEDATLQGNLDITGSLFNHQEDGITLAESLASFCQRMSRVSPQDCENISPSPATEVAFFQLSGGSTGTPKLIPRTHNDYLYSVRRSAEVCALSSDTRFLCALPAAHNFSLSSPGALGVFSVGGTVVLARDPEPTHCFSLIEAHQVTMAALVPPAVSLWITAAKTRQRPLNSLKLLQVGGASFSPAVAKQVIEVLGCQLQQVFGMAEGLVNYTGLDDPLAQILHTQGKPMCPHDEILILDDTGLPVPEGETGTLYTQGPYTIRGYFNSEAHNRLTFSHAGYYCTGDLVQLSPAGYLRVVGRVKDQINRGGEKIAAEEIEALLLHHEQVNYAALLAIPDPLMGEKSCAFIVPLSGTLKAHELRRYLRTLGVADYKLPDKFEFVDDLPLTAVGKIDKKKLKQFYDTQSSVPSI
jgi:2,3-dihydroxybenzoate-AMP ligase